MSTVADLSHLSDPLLPPPPAQSLGSLLVGVPGAPGDVVGPLHTMIPSPKTPSQ